MNNKKLSLDREKKIISECKKDLSKFSLIYEAFVNDIFRYTFVITQDKHKAEDITSQTFLNALEKMRDFEWKQISIKHWLIKIARNLSLKGFKQKEISSLDESIGLKSIEKASLEEMLVSEELKEKLQSYLSKLDFLTREIISLRIWEEYKFDEIASIVDMKKSTVKLRFYRGIEKLKNMAQKDRKAMKLALINIPLIFAGIESLKMLNIFKAESKFKAKLASSISQKINLIVKLNPMNAKVKQSKSTVEHPVSGVKKALMKGTKGSQILKIVIAIVGTIAILGGGLGSYLWLKNKQKGNIQDTTEDSEQQDETTTTDDDETDASDPYEGWNTYINEDYGFSFKYPKDWTVEKEEGGPYIDAALSGGEVEYGFFVILSGENWKYKLIYEPYVDDVTGGNVPINAEELAIGGETRMRVIYDNYDYENNQNADKLYKASIMEVSYYEDKKDSSYWQTAINVKGTAFTLEYDPIVDMTLQAAKEDIELMDKISESLELVSSETYAGWKQCLFDNGTFKVSFKVPQNWECTEEIDPNTGSYSVGVESESIGFWIGFLYQAGCQDVGGECAQEVLYSSEIIKLYRIFNENPDGSQYVNPYGYFFKDGEMENTVGIYISKPDLQNSTLTQEEKDELVPVLDSFSYPE